jgi:hypothetical protein
MPEYSLFPPVSSVTTSPLVSLLVELLKMKQPKYDSISFLSPHLYLFLLPLVLFLISILLISGDVHHLTRDEASHTGFTFNTPPIIQEFDAFLEHYSSSSIKNLNEFTQHHAILKLFCSQRRSCQWFEYYQLLDELRLPFQNFFDPGMITGFKITDLQKKYHSGAFGHQTKCDTISYPSPDEFLEYVTASKPVIIKGSLPSSFNSSSWSLSNLVEIIGDSEVVVSATPTGEFDGPEDPSLWGLPSDPQRYELIVRPGHVNLQFSEFVSLLDFSDSNSESKKKNNSQLYLEYFPLYALFHPLPPVLQEGALHRKGKGKEREEKKKKLLQQLPQYPFAEWLSMKYQLLWLGGGEHETETESSSRGKSSTKSQDKIRSPPQRRGKSLKRAAEGAGAGGPVSRMHYDRMENLMTMVTGKKKFFLYDPSQSELLHGGTPMIQASLRATLHRNSRDGNGDGRLSVSYSRDPSTVSLEPTVYHTYSPVNVRDPNLTKHPKFSKAKGIVCEIQEGDTLYLPSHWWHEVCFLSLLPSPPSLILPLTSLLLRWCRILTRKGRASASTVFSSHSTIDISSTQPLSYSRRTVTTNPLRREVPLISAERQRRGRKVSHRPSLAS